jgi:hypothetical protein
LALNAAGESAIPRRRLYLRNARFPSIEAPRKNESECGWKTSYVFDRFIVVTQSFRLFLKRARAMRPYPLRQQNALGGDRAEVTHCLGMASRASRPKPRRRCLVCEEIGLYGADA